MLTIHQISEQVEALGASVVSVEDFQDWFVSRSWGLYNPLEDKLSRAIAAVHHVLYSYENDDLVESQVAQELATAIRPFERSALGLSFSTGRREWSANFAPGRQAVHLMYGFPQTLNIAEKFAQHA